MPYIKTAAVSDLRRLERINSNYILAGPDSYLNNYVRASTSTIVMISANTLKSH